MGKPTTPSARADAVLLPHLDAAYNLARWLTRNDHDAEVVVQEAFVRAMRYFHAFRGGDGLRQRAACIRVRRALEAPVGVGQLHKVEVVVPG